MVSDRLAGLLFALTEQEWVHPWVLLRLINCGYLGVVCLGLWRERVGLSGDSHHSRLVDGDVRWQSMLGLRAALGLHAPSYPPCLLALGDQDSQMPECNFRATLGRDVASGTRGHSLLRLPCLVSHLLGGTSCSRSELAGRLAGGALVLWGRWPGRVACRHVAVYLLWPL